MASDVNTVGDRDRPHLSPVLPGEDARTVLINNVSWAAVLAGVVVSLVVQLLLNMLGLGIGAATIDPVDGQTPDASTFSVGAGIWWTVAGIIAAFLGGHVAGRLSGRPKQSTAGWHGIIAWAFTTLVVFYLLTSTVGAVIGGAFNTLGSAMSGVGRTAVQTAQSAAPALANVTDPFGAIEREIRESSGNDPQALRDAAVSAVRAALSGDAAEAEEARNRAAEALARAQNISPDEARNRIAQYEQQYRAAAEEARQQATEAAEMASNAVSRGALFGFFALVLGAVAAWFGGRSGTVNPTVTP
jgi:hypothetical protein